MDKLFKAIENITTKGASKLLDLFTVTPEEKAKGKIEPTTTMEKVGQKIGDYFKPTEKVRVRDVVREVPQALSDILGKPLIREATALGSKIKINPSGVGGFVNIDPRAQYIPKTEFEKEITGTDKPIDFSSIGKETRMAKEGAKTIPVVDPALGAFVAMTDIFTGGKGKGAIKGIQLGAKELKNLSKLSKAEEVVKALKSYGVEAKTAESLAGDIAKTTKTSEIAGILGETSKEATKTGKSATEAVSRETEGIKTTTKDIEYAKTWINKRKKSLIQFEDQLKRQQKEGLPSAKKTQKEINWLKKEIEGYQKIIDSAEPTLKEDGVRSVGDVLSEKYGKGVKNVSQETTIDGVKIPKRISESFKKDIINEDFTDIAGIEPKKIKKVQLFGSSVEGKKTPGDIDVFVTVADDATKWNKKGGLINPITFERGKFSYIVMPESEAKDLLDAMLYTGRKDADRAYSGTALNLPKRLWGKAEDVARETRTLKEDGVRTVGDVLQEKYETTGKVSQETPTIENILKPVKNERRFITRVKSMEPNLSKLLKGEKDTRSTEELTKRVDDAIKANEDEAINIAKTDTSDYGVAMASRLIDQKVKLAKEITDEARKNELWAQVADIANESARNLTENGRAIQASTILGKLTPEGMVRFASRTIQKYNRAVDAVKKNPKSTLADMFKRGMKMATKKVPELSGETAKEIADEMTRIEGIADKTEKAIAIQKLTDKVKALVPSSLYDKIVTVWKAGLLTGLKTSGLNIASNTAHNIMESVKDVPATVVDKIASLFTKERTLALTNKGSGKGLKEGIQKGWRYFKTGYDERDVATKIDFNKVNMGKSKFAKAIQGYEETIFKTLGTEDQPFYYTAKARSLSSQAIAKAKNAGLKGKEAKAFVENLIENPTDEMLKYATLDAETAVFQNKTTLGTLAKSMQGVPGGQIILPFAKTPSAVATQIMNYSPVGIVSTIAKNIGKGKFNQRLFAQGMGRGLTGTGILWLGTQLYKNGMVETEYPTSEKERKQWELEGRTSNSIKIGGKWRNSSVLGPAGLLLVIGGHLQKGIDKTGSFIGGLSQASGGLGSTLTDQTFLRGVNQTIEALNDPNRSFNGWASSLAGSIVPTIVADVARATDKYERRTSNPAQRFQSRVPGLRENLEAKVDTFGKKIETPSFLTVMLDATRPGQPTADVNDPIVKELRRLSDAGYPATPTQLGPNAGYESLTGEQNTYLWQLAGNVVKKQIDKTMKSSAWGRLDDEQKQKELENVISDVMVEARARVVLQALNGLSASDKKEKMKEMIKEKLLTRQVYNMYLSLSRKK